ncbi:MAG TPA: hypothetical protein VHJ18_22530 [Streptosporangiaceae bacterium]|nr:hypothetical protein [Streptosporangiaceae bacterium]
MTERHGLRPGPARTTGMHTSPPLPECVCRRPPGFIDLEADDLQHVGEVDVVFDGDILERST